MKTSIARPRQSLNYGQIVDLPEAIAERLIARGAAEPAPDPWDRPPRALEAQTLTADETRGGGSDQTPTDQTRTEADQDPGHVDQN